MIRMVNESETKSNDCVEDISVLSTQRKQDLASWGLPDTILKRYGASGVVSMFPWQVECLSNPRILEGGNLIYSAPTSAGKSLVAEILTIKVVLERKKKVIIILPFVSVVREKMFYFQDLLSSSGVRVEGLMGSRSIRGGFRGVDIAICTIEKANSLVNRLMEEKSLHKVGAVIVDELHLLGDPFRGYLLELLLTKILYMCKREEHVKIQVVGMSATIPNLTLLATWLGADLYQTDFRPVPLKEFLKIGPSVYDNQMEKLYDMQSSSYIQDDPDHVVQLCLETLINGHSVLAFCATKQWCEKLAQHIANMFKIIGLSGSDLGQQLRKQLDSNAIREALEHLQRCPVGLDKVLQCTVAFGVAFHHAGLTLDERDILEGCFRSGTLRVMVATSTLSSGVNLPARRVIIRSPVFHGKSLDSQTYRQMIGRAGRMGQDTAGESFLICNKAEGPIGEKLVGAELKLIDSCLGHGELAASLKRAILEVIASGVACTPQEVAQYTSCTLLATTKSNLQNPISACVQFLETNELIRLQEEENGAGHTYVPTPLGLACLAASVPPDEGLLLFAELQKAHQCFVLDTDFHIIYEVLSVWEQLPSAMQRVGELVGIDERFMVRAMRGTLSLSTSKQVQKMSVHRRFYTALALYDLVNEVPLAVVARKFGCSRGMLQSLQQSASTFAGMVTAFCRRLGWSSLELLVSQFQERLQFGVQRELCDLMRLDGLNGLRARALFDAGISTIADLAAADVCAVENALHKAVPFQSCKELDGETSFETKQRNKLRNVWITGHQGVTEREAASLLISDARSFLQKELGLADAKWSNQESDVSVEESQSLSEQSMHSAQQQSAFHNKSSKLLEQTVSQLSISSHLQSNVSLVEDLNAKIFCETNGGLQKSERSHSLHHSVLRTKLKNLKDGTGKTKTKHLSSKLSDEDYILSPLLDCSQNKSSQRHTSQRFHYWLGKSKKSKMNCGKVSQKTSAGKKICKSKKNIVSKMSVCGTPSANKPYQGSSVFSNQTEHNKLNSTHFGTVNFSSSKESRSEQSLLLETPLVDTVSEKSSNKMNQSIDYFITPLEMSQCKLHEKTEEFKQKNNAKIGREPSSGNIGGKVASDTYMLNNKEHLPENLVSSHITDSPLNKNNIQFAMGHVTNTCLSSNNVNQETELLKKDAVNLDKILNPNISSTSGSLCEELEKKGQIVSAKADNKRRSSDFFSSPISGGNSAHDVESDNQSPSLFGDSLVIDTRLNDILDECCIERQTTVDKNCQNPAQDCNQKSYSDLIIQQELPDKKDHQCITSVCGNSFVANKDEEVVSGKEFYEHKHNIESNSMGARMFSSQILDSVKYSKENVTIGELNLCEVKVCSQMMENFSCQTQDHCHTLSKHAVATHEVLNLKNNKCEVLDKIINSPVYSAGMEGFKSPAASDIIRDSMGREGVILHFSSCGSACKNVSDPQSVYAEELEFCSVSSKSAMSSFGTNIKTKKGLVSPITYTLNEKLLEDLPKCNTALKGVVRTKRKMSVSSDSSYSDNELSNKKRRRVLNRCEIAINDDEINCAKMVGSVLKENDNAEYWLDSQNGSTFESSKYVSPQRQCPDKQQCPNENHKVMEGSLYTENEAGSEQPNPKGHVGITDSFLEKAFNTCWDFDTGTIEEKKDDKVHHDLVLERGGIGTSMAGTLQELHTALPPSESNITQKHNGSDTKCDGITSADNFSPKQNSGDTKSGRKIHQSPCVMSNSLLEAVFNNPWEENLADEDIKNLQYNANQNGSHDTKSNMLKFVDSHNDLRHQELSLENRGNEEHWSSKERKRFACGRRRSPRLLAAAAEKENRNSCGESIETVTKQKNSHCFLQVEEQNNDDSPEMFSAVSNVCSEVLENDDIFISEKLHTEKNLQDYKLESHLQRQTIDKMDFSRDNMDFIASCHAVTELVTTTETPDVKGPNFSSVTDRPTECATQANKILQFNSDSNSDNEAEDDLVNSSQGDEDSRRKWGCDKLEKVRWKISQRDIRNASKSPTHSHQKLSRADGTRAKCVAKKVSSRKANLWGSINIVDVCGHERVWNAFQCELTAIPATNMSIAVACKQFIQPTSSANTCNAGIGARIIGHKNTKPKRSTQDKTLNYGDRSVSGIALCFGGKDVFYINLNQGDQNCIGLQYKLDLIKDLLAGKHAICAFDLKEHMKVLTHCCGIMADITVGHDPKVADWLLEPGTKEKNFHAMVLKYCNSSAINLANLIGSGWGVGSPALNWRNPASARLRACVEAVLTWQLVEAQYSSMEQNKLDRIYADVEMPALLCLARMELNGIGFCKDEAERLRDLLQQQLTALEQHAYKLAGHTFSLTSPAAVSKVLYRELGLTESKLNFKQRHPSTSKEALMQIKCDHPLPEVILQWRKLNSIVTKILYPLLAPGQVSGRILTSTITHTATGRISMHEPNLQNIPRDFEVVIDKTKPSVPTSVSMRLAFVPGRGKVFVSADYCQLELRILAHLAKDSALCSILNSSGDVFRTVAATWNQVSESDVTVEQRQWAKQVCYGIIYGMGAKALGEQLEVEEEDAAVFMDSFKNTYPGVKQFLLDTVMQCRKKGYIETLFGRKRYLTTICSSNAAVRAQAERQAINSTVQGSAADIAKKGMILVESHLQNGRYYSLNPVANLALHLHDEVLYEVHQEHVQDVAHIIRTALENAVSLSVRLPVKMKVGETWGSLQEFKL